jgi:precorrin-2/cobalt-factor-2 C20-methyltransferase
MAAALSGTLYGVGIGPGDPELVTLKALRILKSVPVLAWPAPEEGPSLAREIVAEHLPGNAAIEISEALDAGEDVAVICEGDPFFYGSFMYLYGRLAGDYPVEVIPGVSSLTACAAALGTPLSAKNDVLTVIPGPLDSDTMKQRLTDADAVAIIKVGRHFDRIRNVIDALGLTANARYIERATMGEQRIVPIGEVGDGNAPYFSMILVHKRDEVWK